MNIIQTPEWRKYQGKIRKTVYSMISERNRELLALEAKGEGKSDRAVTLRTIVNYLFNEERQIIDGKAFTRPVNVTVDTRKIDMIREAEPEFNLSAFVRSMIDAKIKTIESLSGARTAAEIAEAEDHKEEVEQLATTDWPE